MAQQLTEAQLGEIRRILEQQCGLHRDDYELVPVQAMDAMQQANQTRYDDMYRGMAPMLLADFRRMRASGMKKATIVLEGVAPEFRPGAQKLVDLLRRGGANDLPGLRVEMKGVGVADANVSIDVTWVL
jgi:hypothetical protein